MLKNWYVTSGSASLLLHVDVVASPGISYSLLDPNLGIFTLFMSKYNFNVDVDVTNIIDESALNVCLAFAKYFQM